MSAPRIASDGSRIAFVRDGETIWLESAAKRDARPLLALGTQKIDALEWQADSKHLIYAAETGEGPSEHVFQIDVAAKTVRDLTPPTVSAARILALGDDDPNELLVQTLEGERSAWDVYRIDLKTGAARLDTENPGNVVQYAVDGELQVRAAKAVMPDGAIALLARADRAAAWREVVRFTLDDGVSTLETLSPDGHDLYAITAQGYATSRLLRYDVALRRATVLARDPAFDIDQTLLDRKTRLPIAARNDGERPGWKVIDPAWVEDFTTLQSLSSGAIRVESMTRDEQRAIVAFESDERGTSYYLYDRSSRRASFLGAQNPLLASYRLAPMQPFSYTSTDGTVVHGYLTLPPGSAAKALPAVVLVHRNPMTRVRWGYDPEAQWLASRGFAVVQPNFRGSIGYGKDFLDARDRGRAAKSAADVLAAADWAVRAGHADPQRIAIVSAADDVLAELQLRGLDYALLPASELSEERLTALLHRGLSRR
ncbi:MAG: S9 family peptidase [Candidatus Eremiobacteraeota bacterium]|nr:S9 family peptidase [Candidatus Eremiobacteraeota bacterium]